MTAHYKVRVRAGVRARAGARGLSQLRVTVRGEDSRCASSWTARHAAALDRLRVMRARIRGMLGLM